MKRMSVPVEPGRRSTSSIRTRMNSSPRPDSDSSPRRITPRHEAPGVHHLEHERRALGQHRDPDRVPGRRGAVLDRVRDGLAHRELDVVARIRGEAEVRGRPLGEVTCLLEETEIRANPCSRGWKSTMVPCVDGK